MQPDIGHLIQGIKRSLNEEILPAISSTFAREQVAYTLFLCEHLANRWDQAHVAATDEHGDVLATLTAAVRLGRSCADPPAAFTAALDAAAAVLAADEVRGPRPLRALTASIHELKRTLVRLLDACEQTTPAHGDTLAEIRSTLRGFMKRQLARDEQWVATAQIGWW